MRATRTLDAGGIDVRRTLQAIGVYPVDPTHRFSGRSFSKAVLSPDGPGTLHLDWASGGRVECGAWGSGAEWLLERAPDWVGLRDDVSGFDPSLHPKIERWWRRFPGVRLAAAGVVWQELALVLLGQRVQTGDAARSWNEMCRRWGEPAPGPHELIMPPAPEVIAKLSYVDLHDLGIERRRADAVLLAARRANRLEEAATMEPVAALERLTALPGLGVWTATATIVACHGDPDTVVLRDWGLPTLVNWVFTGETRRLDPDDGGDETMCAHLEPWRGHRQRIIRLLFAAGVTTPRRAPRLANPDIRRL